MNPLTKWIITHAEILRYQYDYLDANSVVLDLGVHKGSWMQSMFEKYGCTIHGFEPVPELYQYAVNALRNPKLHLYELGLGGTTRKEKIVLADNSSSIYDKSRGTEEVEISVVAIDEMMKRINLQKAELIKINIEGGEFELLEGMIDKGLLDCFLDYQIQFHDIPEIDPINRRNAIREALSKTHELTYDYEFVWENWRRKNSVIVSVPEIPPLVMPQDMVESFSSNGEIPIKHWYFNDVDWVNPEEFTVTQLETNIKRALEAEQDCYVPTDSYLYAAMGQYSLKGKDVLVYGSHKPWYEAIALAYGCASCTVVHEKKIDLTYDRLAYITPEELKGNQYDVIISISLVQHEGLGRYGDTVGPDCDLETMKTYGSHLRAGGMLFLAVCVGQDAIMWNAHRIYGRRRLPLLFQGWELAAAAGFNEAKLDLENDGGGDQPLFMLAPKISSQVSAARATPKIISNVQSGLGNRIKAMVSTLRLDPDGGVYWPQQDLGAQSHASLNCAFSDLFENDIEVKEPFPSNAQFYVSWRFPILPEDPLPAGFSQVQSNCPEEFTYTDPNGRNVDLEYGRIPKEVIDIFVPVFKKIRFTKHIRDEVNAFAQKFSPTTVSVHIRSWRDDVTRREHLYGLEKYIREMEALLKENADVDFYVTADADEVYAELQSRFGDKIHTYSRKSDRATSRIQPQGAVDDMIELLLLSRNPVLIGTHMSTFSEIAWWLGECRARTIIV